MAIKTIKVLKTIALKPIKTPKLSTVHTSTIKSTGPKDKMRSVKKF